jgi:Tfp pilus assembly protein PilF
VASGEQQLFDVINSDPRNFEALDVLASYNEQLNKPAVAIGYRNKIVAIDPFNYQNYLALAQDEEVVGDKGAAKYNFNKVLVIAPKSAEAKKASTAIQAL